MVGITIINFMFQEIIIARRAAKDYRRKKVSEYFPLKY